MKIIKPYPLLIFLLISTFILPGCENCFNNPSNLELTITTSHESGFYENEFFLSVTTNKTAAIFYTTDGSTPSEDSNKYVEPLKISNVCSSPNTISMIDNISSIDVYFPTTLVDKCVIFKAIAITASKETSTIISKTFFVGFNDKESYNNIPIISLIMDQNDLFDYQSGIYVTGKTFDENEHSGYPETYPANYNQKGKKWERPANFTYFDENKKFIFNQEIGIRIHGGWSRAFNQKSFNLYARKEYSETKSFQKTFFDTDSLQSFMLRSGGYRDTFITKVRDSLNQDLVQNEKFSVQNSFPCILFLNGEYWGIYNLQERFTEYYVEEHYGINKDNVIIVENDEIDEGLDSDIAYYEELLNFFKNNSFESSENYAKVHNYIDVEEFAQYMSTELYVGNIDWPGNNVRLWRARETDNSQYGDGKWHFMMYDTDDSSNILSNKCSYESNPFLNKNHWKDGPLDNDCILGLMLSKLLKNNEFKNIFVDTFKRIGSENFSPYKVEKYLDDKIALLGNSMQMFYQRFVSSDIETYNKEYFVEQINVIKDFFNNRYSNAIQFLYNALENI